MEEVIQAISELLSSQKKIQALKGLVTIKKTLTREHHQKVIKVEKELNLSKAAIKASKEKVEAIKAQAIMEKSMAVAKAKLQAIK